MRVESARCWHIYIITCGQMSDIYIEYIRLAQERYKTREIISINSEADSNTFCYDSITYCVQNLSCLVV